MWFFALSWRLFERKVHNDNLVLVRCCFHLFSHSFFLSLTHTLSVSSVKVYLSTQQKWDFFQKKISPTAERRTRFQTFWIIFILPHFWSQTLNDFFYKNGPISASLYLRLSAWHNSNLNWQKCRKTCSGLESGAAGWKVQTNPLSYVGTPLNDFFA